MVTSCGGGLILRIRLKCIHRSHTLLLHDCSHSRSELTSIKENASYAWPCAGAKARIAHERATGNVCRYVLLIMPWTNNVFKRMEEGDHGK